MGRPYYQRSKEFYDLMSAVIQRFLPGVTLSKENLREVLAQIQGSEMVMEDKEQAGKFSINNQNDRLADDEPVVTDDSPIQETALQTSIDLDFRLAPTSASLSGHIPLLQNTVSPPASEAATKRTASVLSTSISDSNPISSQPTPLGGAKNALFSSSQGPRADEAFPAEAIASRETADITSK